MDRLTAEQREQVGNFRAVTGTTINMAIAVLTEKKWNLAVATDDFFDGFVPADTDAFMEDVDDDAGGDGGSVYDTLFDQFAEDLSPDEDDVKVIGDCGMEKLSDALSLSPEDSVLFALAWKCESATLGVFTREEFTRGVKKIGAKDVATLTTGLVSLRAQLIDDLQFKEFYVFMFDYGKDATQKGMGLDVALAIWEVSLKDRFKLLDQWLEYMKDHTRSVSRDLWTQLLEFSKTVQGDLSNYNDEGAWPVLIDEFVEWVREKDQMQT